MGKPQSDFFCGNGHHIDGAGDNCYCKYDYLEEFPPCPICGNPDVILELDWGDVDSGSTIPVKPVRYEDCEERDHYGNPYFRKVAIYDVSSKTSIN